MAESVVKRRSYDIESLIGGSREERRKNSEESRASSSPESQESQANRGELKLIYFNNCGNQKNNE